MTTSRLDACEAAARTAGGLIALVAAALVVPSLPSSTRPGGRVVGRPERVLSQSRLTLISIGWFAVAALLWRPLPLRLRPGQRLTLLLVSLPVYLIGFAGIIAGRVSLGESYRVSSSVGLRLAPGHRLVVSGPYAIVRHPMYVGLILAAVGALLLYRTWATVFFVAQLPTVIARARLEDQALAAEFGTAWSAYRERVPGWVPRLTNRTARETSGLVVRQRGWPIGIR